MSLSVSGNSAYTLEARNNNNAIKYSIIFPTYSSTLAAANTLDKITAYGFNAIHPNSDAVIRLGADKGDYDTSFAPINKRSIFKFNSA